MNAWEDRENNGLEDLFHFFLHSSMFSFAASLSSYFGKCTWHAWSSSGANIGRHYFGRSCHVSFS